MKPVSNPRKILVNKKTGDILIVHMVAHHETHDSVSAPCTEILDGVGRSRLIPDDSRHLKLFDEMDDAKAWSVGLE